MDVSILAAVATGLFGLLGFFFTKHLERKAVSTALLAEAALVARDRRASRSLGEVDGRANHRAASTLPVLLRRLQKTYRQSWADQSP